MVTHTSITRRALVTGLTAAPVALAVPVIAQAATPEPDPILAAIEANRRYLIADDDYEAYRETWETLKATKPTTMAGALALVLYAREHEQHLGAWNLDDGTAQALDMAANAAALFVPWADLSAPAPDTDALPPMPENFIHHRPGYVAAWVPASDGGGWILVSREYLEEFRRTCPNAIIAEIPGHGTGEA